MKKNNQEKEQKSSFSIERLFIKRNVILALAIIFSVYTLYLYLSRTTDSNTINTAKSEYKELAKNNLQKVLDYKADKLKIDRVHRKYTSIIDYTQEEIKKETIFVDVLDNKSIKRVTNITLVKLKNRTKDNKINYFYYFDNKIWYKKQ